MIAWPNDYPDLRTTLAPVPGADVLVSNRGSFASLRRPGYFLPTLRVESASGKSRPVLHPKIPHRARPVRYLICLKCSTDTSTTDGCSILTRVWCCNGNRIYSGNAPPVCPPESGRAF